MEWNQHSALSDLVLDEDQIDFLNTVQNRSRHNMANIAVRGDVSEQVCPLACPAATCLAALYSGQSQYCTRRATLDQVGGLAQAGLRESKFAAAAGKP